MQMSKGFFLITVGLARIYLQAQTLTKDNSAPLGYNQNSITAGKNGSVLLQGVPFIQKYQRFAKERIPERVVHARGTGVYGDFSDLTVSEPFTNKTKVAHVFDRYSLERITRNTAPPNFMLNRVSGIW